MPPDCNDATRELAARMGERATDFLAALAPDQRATALFHFADDAERRAWFYTPEPHHGLALRDMDPRQRRLALRLAHSGLSRSGYTTAAAIMGLETVLDAVEGWRHPPGRRDPLGYHVSVFGTPDARRPWGWRFEGHHLSFNYTLAGGQVVSPTPAFFGANPGESPLGVRAFLRPLAPVEDLARELVHTLSDERRGLAILAPAAPIDIVMSNRPRVMSGALPFPPRRMMRGSADESRRALADAEAALGFTAEHAEALRFSTAPKGLAVATMAPAERELFAALLRAYTDRMPDELAEIEGARLAPTFDQLCFAWAGGIEPRQPHYYRVQGARLLVEYDNSQDDANHIHSVWRDPANDFGADLLARHYAHAH